MIKFITTKWKQFLTGFIALFIGTCFASQVGLPEQVNLNAELMQTQYNKSAEIKERYSLKDTKLTTKIKHIDDIKITVGGIDEFRPIAEISKWENEVSMRVSPKTNSKSKKKDFVIEGEKIKYKEDKKEFHFYEIEDGYEVEVILLEKPKTNIVEMEIETDGLDFFYQPELTQQEIDDGHFRADKIIGSYAVYHSTKSNHILGQKNYMTGKAFHIFRPLIIDNLGAEVWGSLNIDIENKLLTVEIPQSFLDNAVYPIRHAAGLTFGYEVAGESWSILSSNFRGSLFSTGGAGTATNLTAYLKESNGGLTPISLGIYKHSDGVLIYGGDSDVVVGTTGAWKTFSASGSLTATTEYVLTGHGDAGTNPSMAYDTGDANQGHYLSWPGGWPDPITWGSEDTKKFSIYCTYTAGGEEEAPAKKQDVIWFE